MKSNKLMVIAGLILASAGIEATDKSYWESFKDGLSNGYNSSKDTVVAHPYYTAGGVVALGVTSYLGTKLYKYLQNQDVLEADKLFNDAKANVETFARNHKNKAFGPVANKLQAQRTEAGCTEKEFYNETIKALKQAGYNCHALVRQAYRNKGKIALGLAGLALTGYGLNYGYNWYTTPVTTTPAPQKHKTAQHKTAQSLLNQLDKN